MVAVLVCDDVRLDERCVLCPEPPKLVEEAEVDVDELVRRAVERPDLGVRRAAARVDLAGEEHRVDVLVLPVAAPEDAVPELLDAVNDCDDAAVLPSVRVLPGPALTVDVGRGVTLPDLLVLERCKLAERVSSVREERDQQVDDEPDDAEPTAADGDSAWTDAAAADIGDLARIEGSIAAKTHCASLA